MYYGIQTIDESHNRDLFKRYSLCFCYAQQPPTPVEQK